MKYLATINGKKFEIEVERIEEYRPLSRGEKVRQEEAAGRGRTETAKALQQEAAREEKTEALGKTDAVREERAEAFGKADMAEQPAGAAEKFVESPLIGKIVRVLVSEGQHVNLGDTLLLIEAMKMETEIVAPVEGTVSGIAVEAGQQVEAGMKLLVIG